MNLGGQTDERQAESGRAGELQSSKVSGSFREEVEQRKMEEGRSSEGLCRTGNTNYRERGRERERERKQGARVSEAPSFWRAPCMLHVTCNVYRESPRSSCRGVPEMPPTDVL